MKTVGTLFTAALLVMLIASTHPFTAHATDNTVTPASRFATFEVTGTLNSEAIITMPAGFPHARAVKTPLSTEGREQLRVDTPPALQGPFWDRFTENGAASDSARPFLFLPGKQADATPVEPTITITFDSPVAAGLVGFNIQDVDYEVVYIKIVTESGRALTSAECGFEGVFNALPPKTTVPTVTLGHGDEGFEDFCVKMSGPGTNTDGASAWFSPTTMITQIVLVETLRAAGSFGWLAADRPQPTITPSQHVPTTFTLGDTPISLTPDMFTISWPEGILADQFTPDGDFDDTVGVQFRVKNDGGTGCTLDTNSPLMFSATSPGTCIIECVQPERPNFLSASIDIAITVEAPALGDNTTQPPLGHTATPAREPRSTPDGDTLPTSTELAATGANPWPVWAGVVVGIGAVVMTMARFCHRRFHAQAL
jgi:hypothetical protein